MTTSPHNNTTKPSPPPPTTQPNKHSPSVTTNWSHPTTTPTGPTPRIPKLTTNRFGWSTTRSSKLCSRTKHKKSRRRKRIRNKTTMYQTTKTNSQRKWIYRNCKNSLSQGNRLTTKSYLAGMTNFVYQSTDTLKATYCFLGAETTTSTCTTSPNSKPIKISVCIPTTLSNTLKLSIKYNSPPPNSTSLRWPTTKYYAPKSKHCQPRPSNPNNQQKNPSTTKK